MEDPRRWADPDPREGAGRGRTDQCDQTNPDSKLRRTGDLLAVLVLGLILSVLLGALLAAYVVVVVDAAA